jgi:hypothetical protein
MGWELAMLDHRENGHFIRAQELGYLAQRLRSRVYGFLARHAI